MHWSNMHRYDARELVSPPGLLSLVRAPLAVAFPFALHEPRLAFAVLGAAAVSDVLDGFTARRLGRVTPTGAILDPLMDKVFVTTVIVTLIVGSQASLRVALLLSVREIIELPLAIWFAVDSRSVGARL